MLDEKMIARISYWTNNNLYTGANVKNAYYGKPITHTEYMLSEADAIAALRTIISGLRVMESKFGGECKLTDNIIRRGEEIYYGSFQDFQKMVIRKSDVDAILD